MQLQEKKQLLSNIIKQTFPTRVILKVNYYKITVMQINDIQRNIR